MSGAQEPLLKVDNSADVAPQKGNAKPGNTFVKLDPASFTMFVMNQKNWPFLSLFSLAGIVFLLFLYHEVERPTPVITVVAALVSIVGLAWAGYNGYLSMKLEEQIEKFQFLNLSLERKIRGMAVELDKFKDLRDDLTRFGTSQNNKFEETFSNVMDIFNNVKGTLKEQRKTMMEDIFVRFEFMDNTEGLSKLEFQRASHTIPDEFKQAWGKYTFETFPRKEGQGSSDPITMDEFTDFVDEVLDEDRKKRESNDISDNNNSVV